MNLFVKIYNGLCRRLLRIKWRRRLAAFGSHSYIQKPLYVEGNNIYIGNNVFVRYKSWLAAMPLTGAENCRLEIGDNCIIGHFNEIYATRSIIIESHVLTADRVYISDNIHGYENIDSPVIAQQIVQKNEVRIGSGSWIGAGACIIGASVGKHCVIGANAVVTHDIPDYSVAAGIPAVIIKRYNRDAGCWQPTRSDGSFIENTSQQ